MIKALREYFGGFGKLRHMPREFFGTQLLVLLDCFAYFLMVFTATVFLTQDAGLSDKVTGIAFAVFVTGVALLNMPAGPIIEMLGYRRTIQIGSACGFIGRVGIALAPFFLGKGTVAQVIVFGSMLLASVAEGLLFPIMSAGTKRYSTPETETVAFNFNYLVMQIGAIMAGFTLDWTRNEKGGNYQFFLIPAALAITTLLVSIFMFRKEPKKADSSSSLTKAMSNFINMTKAVMSQQAFWKMITALILILGARMSFVYPMAIYPKYYLRVLGDDAAIGKLSVLNPAIIFLGLFLLTPALEKKSVYGRMMVGMLIAVGSNFFLALSPSIFVGYGMTIEKAYLTMILLQIVVFAFGEMVWGPVMQQYMLAFAPKGQEASYAGFGMLPSVLSKMLTGLISGFMLARWCPEGIRTQIDARALSYGNSPEMMNLILGLLGLSSPLLFWLFRRWVMPDQRQDPTPTPTA